MSRLAEERGLSLVELLVAVAAGVVVLGALVTVVNIADRGSGRVAARVDANQRARPVMQRIMDQLHSTCVARGIAPILPNSTGDRIEFVHQTGSEAVLTNPVKRQISFEPDPSNPGEWRLAERVYPKTGGTDTAPTFSSTQSGPTRVLLTGVGRAELNGTPNMAIFRYFGYSGTAVSTTPFPTPLSAANASRTVQVEVAFTAAPMDNPTGEDATTATVTDSAQLRFAPAGETTTPENLPCV